MKCFGRRSFSKHIKIILLDDQEIIQEVQRTTTGQELLDNVYKHLNIIETSYFGLRFVDNSGQTHWLDPGKSVIKQLSGTDPASFYFGVKFYAADPCKLFEEITRYQFFLQIKKDILQGRLTVSNDLAATLGASAIQSELGDYDPKRHISGYVSEFRFISNQTAELEEKISELHKAMIGEVPAIAELNYLEKVKWLEMYGVDLHPVLGEDKIDYFLGLTPSGIIVLRNKNKVGNYFWPRISKISMKGKYFMIRVKNRSEEETYGFETPSKAACKHLWKCAMDHHTFFRLVQVTPTPNTNMKTFSLNNRFRDSNHSNMSSASRRRAQPQFIRTPSRRYTRRYVEGSELSTSGHQESLPPVIPNHVLQPTQPKSMDSNNWKPMPMTSSPKSTRSVPLNSNNHHNNSYTVPSPRSQRSRKRSKSIESNSSCEREDGSSHRRHSHSRRKHRHSSSRKSDGESEVSNQSRSSSKKRYRHKSKSYDQSGSDSENQPHRRRHRHRHRSGKDEMIEWKEATMSTVQQSVSSVKTLGNEPEQTKYGAPPSKASSQSGHGQRNHRHHSRRSSMEKPTSEIKKYFNYELIDTDGMSREELNSLPFTNVMTNGEVSMKNRVIMKQHRGKYVNPNSSNAAGGSGSPHSSHQQQQQQHSVKSPPDVTLTKMCTTTMLPSSTGDNSPPPPYSPPTNDPMNFGLPSQTPSSQQPPRGYHFQSKEQESDWSSSLNRKKNPGRSRAGIYDNIHSESPVKEQLENSDSGLGTDREYYRAENIMSSLSYALPNHNTAAPQRPAVPYNQQMNYWNERSGGEAWPQQPPRHQPQQQQHDNGQHPAQNDINNDINRSSSLEMILSPLVSSTTTNRTRL